MRSYLRGDHLVIPSPVEPLRAVGDFPIVIDYHLEGDGGLA
jgi:hypothetical protein